jgi:hypothetical protein
VQPPAHAGSSLTDFSTLKMEAIRSPEISVHTRSTSLEPPAYAGSSFADFSTLKMEAIRSSEPPVHTRSTRRHIPEDGILYSNRRENPRSYTIYTILALGSVSEVKLYKSCQNTFQSH